MINLNYNELSNVTHTVSTIPYVYDTDGVDITDQITNLEPLEFVRLHESPSISSSVKINIPNNASVTMLREWVTGKKDWAYVKYNNEKGFILTQHLSLLSGKILPKAEISLKALNRLEEALAPHTTWMNNSKPYYHPGNGEWWFTITLPYTCIEEGSLEERKDEAKTEAIAYMYEYFDLNVSNKVYTQQEFKDGLQSCYLKEYYLDTRPESQLMMLVTIPDIYIEWLKIHNVATEISPDELDSNYCISIPANSTEDLNTVRNDIKDCLVNLYKKYLESNIKVTNFDFINEIAKQYAGLSQIKVLLELNNIDLGSASNQAASEDACAADPKYKKIEICFSNDGNYNLLAVYYYNNSGEKTTLSTGLNSIKNSYPFNEARFGHLFLNHQKLCSLPEPVLTEFFDEYCVDPIPTVEIVPIEEKPILTPAQQEQLGIAINTALFLGSMAQQFGLILDGEGENSLGFNCYSSSKSLDAFKLKSMELRDSQFMYGADVANFINFVCELIDKSNEEIEEEGSRVPPGGLPGLPGLPGPPGASDWGWAWLFGIVGDADSWEDLFNLTFGDWKMPTFGWMEQVEKAAENLVKEAKDSMVYSLIKVFLQLNCQALVAGTAVLGAIGVAAYLISQIDDDDDDETQAKKKSFGLNPSPADLLAKDYGAENCNDIIQESIKVSPENYDKYIVEKFLRCGVYIPSDMSTLPRQYLDGVSSIISPVEMLALLKGSSSIAVLQSIVKYTQNQFPTIFNSLNTQSKVSNFFVCLGEETTPQSLAKVEEKIKEKALDSDYCLDIAEKLIDIMKNKCPSPEAYSNIYQKEFGSNIEMYQELITLIDDQCSNVNLKLYSNPETGEKGLLNSLNGKLEGEGKANDSMAEALIGGAKATGMIESQSIISGSEYQSNLEQVSEAYTDNLLVVYTPIKSDTGGEYPKGTATGYRHNKALVDDAYDNQIPTYRLRPNGNNYIYDKLKDKAYYIQNPQVSTFVQSLVDNNENYDFSQNSLLLSQNQAVFYAMIDNYFKNNSKSHTGGTEEDGPPVPYGVFTELLEEKHDYLFRTIFQVMIERYARKVGFAWQGDQTNALNAYSQALTNNLSNMLNYEQAKKECTKYFDVSEYDNPNDTSIIGPKQYSIMNGLLYTYARLHIIEYLAMLMPFYEVFEFKEGGVEQDLYELFPEFVKSYIREKMIEGLPSGYQTHANNTYEFVKKRMSYQIKEYAGDTRGLDYYIETNYQSVLDAFNQAMNEVPSGLKKSKNWLQTDNFIYSRKNGLEVHKHAGSMNLFLTIDTNWGKPDLKGESCFTNTSNESYSLFAEGRYNKFRNGMFFIQNYFYFTAYTDVGVDKLYLRGVLNLEHLKEINNIFSSDQKTKPLSNLFSGNCKYGARLCFGVAYSKGDSSIDSSIKARAKEMFLNYKSPGDKGNLGKLNNYYKSSKKQLSLQKSIICVDGKDMLFNRYPAGSDVPVKMDSGESFTSLTDDFFLLDKFEYEGDASDYSMVIPIFNVEEDINKNLSWEQFYSTIKNLDSINELEVFGNLNSQLINSNQYSALIKNCFSPENMVHFNAISGIRTTSLLDRENYVQTKNLLVSSMKNVINVKSLHKTIT